MLPYKIRGMSTSGLMMTLILTLLCVIPVGMLCSWMQMSFKDSYWAVLLVFVVLAGPMIVCLFAAMIDYATILTVHKDRLIYSCPFRHPQVIEVSRLSAYGLISWFVKTSKLYFCIASEDAIWQFYDSNPDKREALFGKHTADRLKETENGRWQLAVGMYVKENPTEVYYIGDGTIERLGEIKKVIIREPVNTGYYLLNHRQK